MEETSCSVSHSIEGEQTPMVKNESSGARIQFTKHDAPSPSCAYPTYNARKRGQLSKMATPSFCCKLHCGRNILRSEAPEHARIVSRTTLGGSVNGPLAARISRFGRQAESSIKRWTSASSIGL